jgi:hypothetical protein
MKKYISFCLILFCTLAFWGCKKETTVFRVKPKIVVSGAGGLSLVSGVVDAAIIGDTTVRLVYTIAAEETIKTITQTINGVNRNITDVEGKKTYTLNIDVPLSLSDLTPIKVGVFVTDNNSLINLVENSITIRKRIVIVAPKNLTLYSNAMLAGWSGSGQSAARMDLDLGKGYSNGTINGNLTLVPLIDIFMDNGKFFNNDVPYSTRWPNGMGSKFSATTVSEAAFNSMTTDLPIQLLNLNLVDDLVVTGLAGKVIYFQTSLGNKGLMLIKTYDASLDEMAFDIKVTN